jgi:hypothetical protein
MIAEVIANPTGVLARLVGAHPLLVPTAELMAAVISNPESNLARSVIANPRLFTWGV